ncbi:hypothetical protein [Methanobrevibacter sp. V74]|uniref:hypothetical protein n=1 Tax=Methanobrevibacter sp. V74 TaxID=3064279 RepID=UPI002733C23D|nr:hypothetical protein [Methanobrevibacter sp. V74]
MLNNILESKNSYVVQQAIMLAIGISNNSPEGIITANVNNKVLMLEEVKLIFEVKISIVRNWEYDMIPNPQEFINCFSHLIYHLDFAKQII